MLSIFVLYNIFNIFYVLTMVLESFAKVDAIREFKDISWQWDMNNWILNKKIKKGVKEGVNKGVYIKYFYKFHLFSSCHTYI